MQDDDVAEDEVQDDDVAEDEVEDDDDVEDDEVEDEVEDKDKEDEDEDDTSNAEDDVEDDKVEDDDVEDDDAAPQTCAARFARACAIKWHMDMSQEPCETEIYREMPSNAAPQERDTHFARACAVEMPTACHKSHEERNENYRANAAPQEHLLHSTPYTLHCTLHTQHHSTLYTPHSTFHTLRLRLRPVHSTCTFSTSQLPTVFPMCFAPQRRPLFRHLNFQKCSESVCRAPF